MFIFFLNIVLFEFFIRKYAFRYENLKKKKKKRKTLIEFKK